MVGEIPEGWEVIRFRNIFLLDRGLNITKENLQEHGIPCVNYGEIHSKCSFQVSPLKNQLKCVSYNYLEKNKKSLLADGNFIFADTSEDIEGAGNFTQLIYQGDVFAGYHTIIARLLVNQNSRFLAYAFDSLAFRNQIRRLVKGVKVYSITQSILKSTFIWLATLKEQTLIANFLDQKTAQIDAAIAIKEQQIELLKERKQIIIQQAVTQGLDPTVSMKNSGVDWIGVIPAHWDVMANRNLFIERVEAGKDGLPLLSVSIHSGVSNEEISEDENIRGRVKIEDKSKYILVKKGDIAFNMMRAWQGGIGAVRTDGMVSPAYIVAKPKGLVIADYFELQYRCPDFIQQMDRYSKGITDFRKRLYWDGFKQLKTVVPPLKEQVEIINHVQAISNSTEKALNFLLKQIEKLKEYKTTLIDSAVTGKIKITADMIVA